MRNSGAARIAVAGAVVVTAVGAGYLWGAGTAAGDSAAAPLPRPTVTLTPSSTVLAQHLEGELDGCGAYSFFAPESPDPDRYLSAVGVPLEDGAVMISCTPHHDELPDLEAFVALRTSDPEAEGGPHLLAAPLTVVTPIGTAVRLDTDMGRGRVLSEWFVDREGGLLGIGYLHDPATADWETVEAILGSWRWA